MGYATVRTLHIDDYVSPTGVRKWYLYAYDLNHNNATMYISRPSLAPLFAYGPIVHLRHVMVSWNAATTGAGKVGTLYLSMDSTGDDMAALCITSTAADKVGDYYCDFAIDPSLTTSLMGFTIPAPAANDDLWWLLEGEILGDLHTTTEGLPPPTQPVSLLNIRGWPR